MPVLRQVAVRAGEETRTGEVQVELSFAYLYPYPNMFIQINVQLLITFDVDE